MYYKLRAHKKTVTTSGTAERLYDGNIEVDAVNIQALAANTNDVYVGDSEVSDTSKNGFCLDARESISFVAKDLGLGDAKIKLKDIWLDVDTNGEGVVATYFLRE